MNSPISHQFAITANGYNYENRYRHLHHHLNTPENIFDDDDQVPSPSEFDAIIDDYLQNLSPKKRDKALVDQQRYQQIHQVLKDPRNTAISTAQFRFWVKKMFELQPGIVELVCHDGKPVAMREQIYAILVKAHREAHHGGRDKTSALVRRKFSWIPKELVARFVRHCPFCITRRNGGQSPAGAYQSIGNGTHPLPSAYIPSATIAQQHYHHNNNPVTTGPSMFCTPLIHDGSDIGSSGPPSTEHGCDASPNYNMTSPSRRPTPFIYDKDEEELLKSHHHHHYYYRSPSEAFHQYPFDMISPSKVIATPSLTTTTNDDHTPNNTSDLMIMPLSPLSGSGAAFFYHQQYMDFSSYYYPNVLGIAPCSNITPTTTTTATTATASAANNNNAAVAELLNEDVTDMLIHHRPQDDSSATLPFSITADHPQDHFIPISNDNNGSTAPHCLLTHYD